MRPRGPVPADITDADRDHRRHGRPSPEPGPTLRAFLAFASDCVLVAHNAPFDMAFLTAACADCRHRLAACAVLDTAVLARLLLGPDDVPDCRLGTLAGYFAARTTPCHRALADAKATADVLAGLLGLAAGRPTPCAPAQARQHRQLSQAVRYWRGWGARSRRAGGGELWSPQSS